MKIPKLTLTLAASLMLPVLSYGQTLMVNFGTQPVDFEGSSLTNSPYHTASGGTFTDTSWNQVGLANVSAGGLNYSNGSVATGVSLTLGAATGSVVNFNTLPSNQNTLGVVAGATIYNLSTMRSAIWNGGSGTDSALGVRIDGLAAGQYEVYVWGAFTNTNLTNFPLGKAAKFFYADAGSSSDTFDISLVGSMTGSDPVNPPDAHLTSPWTEGDHYAKVTLNVGAGESLYVASGDAVWGVDDDQTRGILSGMQIVAVPEPSTYALLLGALGLGMVLIRRRRHS